MIKYKIFTTGLANMLIATVLLSGFQTNSSAATPSPVRAGAGAIALANQPTGFYIGFDGNLWENSWISSNWASYNHGTPPGVSLDRPLGAYVSSGKYPSVAMLGSDGNLWSNYWSGSSWLWSNNGHPPGNVSIVDSLGSYVSSNAYPAVVVYGSDGNLWRNYWNGSRWQWENGGTPSSGVSIARPMGTYVNANVYPSIAVLGSDGNLWHNHWNGTLWQWINQGKPSAQIDILDSMGAYVNSGNYPSVVALGSDGNIWHNFWNGSTWQWNNNGRPPGNVSVAASMGSYVVRGTNPSVMTAGSDGNLWANYWSGSAWIWENLGAPPGARLSGFVGSTQNAGYPQIFVVGSDSNLWLLGFDGSRWSWSNQTAASLTPSHVGIKYKVLGVDYAPPGSRSNVNYSGSTIRGTSTSTEKSYQTRTDISADVSVFSFGASVSASYSQQTTNSSSVAVVTTTANSTVIAGPAASSQGVNHDYDVIWIWLNPRLEMTKTGPFSIRWGGYSFDPANPAAEMDIVPLYVHQLKNPATIPPATASRLARSWDTSGLGGLVDADFQEILAANPFTNGSFNPNTDTSGRFDLQAGYTFSFQPPPLGGQPITQTFSVQRSRTSSTGKTVQHTYQVGYSVNEGMQILGPLLASNVKNAKSLSLTDRAISGTIATDTNTASLSITGPAASDNYQGPTSFQVWRDNVYGSFAFYPVR